MNRVADPLVLIVEDERHLANVYAGWLRDRYRVRVAYDGEEAMDSLDETVDVVLLDRRMPGLSGDEVLEVIRDREYACKVAMVTAIEPDFDIIEMGFDAYLVKPASLKDLESTIERLLARRTYDEQVDEYARLLSKKVALETEKSRRQLELSREFSELESRIEQLGSNVDRMVRRFDQDDVTALFRDLPVGQGC